MSEDVEYLVALGGNLPSCHGDPVSTMRCALGSLAANGVVIRAISRFFRTPAFPAGSGPEFVNAAAVIKAGPDVQRMLDLLHQLEAEAGRQRRERWGPRELDLDLLACGHGIWPNSSEVETWLTLPPDQRGKTVPKELILPHPRLQERAFVLVPLADIRPGWRHPLLGKTVYRMLAELPSEEIAPIQPI